jgi:hypothetical protein
MTETVVATPPAVQTPKQAKIATDAAARKAEKAAADAQVAEDTAVFEAAKAAQKTAFEVKTKADADAFAALAKASDVAIPPPADPTDTAAVAARNAILVANSILVSEAVTTQQTAQEAEVVLERANAEVVRAKDALVASTAVAAGLADVSENSPWYYCLEHTHSGDLKSTARFFQSDETGCPVCPQCKRQVSAAPTTGFGVYPPGVLAIHERLTGGKV